MGDIDDLENVVVPSSSTEEDNHSKIKKRKLNHEEEGIKKEKVWSEKDEITLLEVLKKRSNKSNMSRLYTYVKSHLEAEFTKAQVTKKVSMFKNSFINTTSTSDGEALLAASSSSHDAKIRELCTEIWGGHQTTDQPRMTTKQFQARYPRVSACIDNLPPYNTMTDQGRDVIKQCMTLLSPTQLEEMEDEWMTYHEEGLDRTRNHFLLGIKHSRLLQKGTRNYNLAHQN